VRGMQEPWPEIPERLNIADAFLDARVRGKDADRVALRTIAGNLTYGEVHERACRYANLLRELGVRPEERVIVALPDGPEWVAAFFGILKLGAVVVMVNPQLGSDAIEYFYQYTRARTVLVNGESLAAFRGAERGSSALESAQVSDGVVEIGSTEVLRALAVVDDAGLQARLERQDPQASTFDSHRDDAAIWLFSGGTTGKPKAVVQSHRSFLYTTRCYGQGVLGIGPDDITLSVPKLFFGYATGSNLLFPFSVGGSAVLFPERCTADALFEQIERHRPTILINVPTMINQMVSHPDASEQDLSCLRLSTSAGEALPVELHERWDRAFGVEMLDGLGTAEQWHVFLSNRPGDVTPGTLGRPVPGFTVKVCDEAGAELPDGEIGYMWVAGGARATAYWQRMERTEEAFRGRWYASGDMVRRDPDDGTFTYCGRGDDMLKVSGKWLSPGEVENCLMRHEAVREVAVVGVEVAGGLVKPKAFVLAAVGHSPNAELGRHLQDWVRSRLEPYKYPREVEFLDDFPRTHLGKIDRGALKSLRTRDGS
jgi:benzoate-CoA ligase family protein